MYVTSEVSLKGFILLHLMMDLLFNFEIGVYLCFAFKLFQVFTGAVETRYKEI